MTTTTSSSKKGRFFGLYKTALLRNGGYFGLVSALIFIFYPFQYAMEAFKTIPADEIPVDLLVEAPLYGYSFHGLAANFTGVSIFFFTVIILLTPLVLALVLNSYMHSKKAADVFHSLPVKREMLLAVNAAVAMTIITVPVVASNIFIACLQIAKFGYMPVYTSALVLDTFGWLAAAFAIYAVTTFVSVCLGTSFDTFVFTGVLVFAVPAVWGLFLLTAEMFLYGWTVSENTINNLCLFSPVLFMPARFSLSGSFTGTGMYGFGITPEYLSRLAHSNTAIAGYLIFAVLLLLVSMRIYRRRSSEIAETTTSKGILQMTVKMIGTLICGISVGLMFYALSFNQNKMIFIMWTLIGGLLANVIIESILNRGFKTIVKSLPVGFLMTVVTVGVFSMMLTGGLGYESRIPKVENVASVSISYKGAYSWACSVGQVLPQGAGDSTRATYTSNGNYYGPRFNYNTLVILRNPENVEVVLNYHQDTIDKKAQLRSQRMSQQGESNTAYIRTRVEYTLKDGRIISRYYDKTTLEAAMELAKLELSEEFLMQTHPAYFNRAEDIMQWSFADPFGTQMVNESFTVGQSQTLLDAIKADIAAQTLDSLIKPQNKMLARIQFTALPPDPGVERFAAKGYFDVTDSDQQTYRLLEDLGILDKLTPDISECIAVSTHLYHPESAKFGRQNNSAIVQNFENVFWPEELHAVRDRIAQQEQNMLKDPIVAEKEDDEVLFEDPADIRVLAEAVVASAGIGEPVVNANFYFEGQTTGTSVLIQLSKLPGSISARLQKDMAA